ncbi:MAG: hypothetical protein ACFFDI_18430 [Promethearchaeota archaeon]
MNLVEELSRGHPEGLDNYTKTGLKPAVELTIPYYILTVGQYNLFLITVVRVYFLFSRATNLAHLFYLYRI